jgi:hypothetical protein
LSSTIKCNKQRLIDIRQTTIVLVLCSLFLLTACTQDLPPTPGVPGAATPIGKATGAFEGYAEPTTLQITPTSLVLSFADLEGTVDVSVTGEQYVYKTGYVLDVLTDSWKAFEFSEATVPLTNWIKGDASKTLTILKDELGIETEGSVTLYVIAYACSKSPDNTWDCHESKWMIKDFTASVESAPEEPGAPGGSPKPSCSSDVATDNEDCIESSLDQPLSAAQFGVELHSLIVSEKYVESEGDNKNSIDYDQDVVLGGVNPKVIFGQDDDLAPVAGNYLFVDKGQDLYTYTLSFDSPVEYSTTNPADDFIHSTLSLLETTYYFTDVASNIDGTLDSLRLMKGEAALWLTQNIENQITKSVNGVDHTFEVLDVTETEDACQIKVDDTTAIIDVGEVKVVNGVNVGVLDARVIFAPNSDQDTCQIVIDAHELLIRNNNRVRIDDVEIDGSESKLLSSTAGQLSGLSITYDGSDLDDDFYVGTTNSFTEPIFGLEFTFEGDSANVGKFVSFIRYYAPLQGTFTETTQATAMFEIADVTGKLSSYSPSSDVVIQLKGVEPDDGSPTEPTTGDPSSEGFNVQYYVKNSQGDQVFYGNGDWVAGNGIYNSDTNLWDISFKAPEVAGSYELTLYLYCALDEAICATKYGIAAQVEYKTTLEVA